MATPTSTRKFDDEFPQLSRELLLLECLKRLPRVRFRNNGLD
jgi:hypothetical protein